MSKGEWIKKKNAIPIEKLAGKASLVKKRGRKKSNHKHDYKHYLTRDVSGMSSKLYMGDGTWFTFNIGSYHRGTGLKGVYLFKECSICGYTKDFIWMIDMEDNRIKEAIELEKGIKNDIRIAHENAKQNV